MAPMSVTGHSPITPSPTRAHPHAQRNPLYGNAKRGRAPSYGARSAVTPTPIKHLSTSGYDPAEDVALQPYGYTGRRYDNETKLWYFRARYFDDTLGRFIARDPMGYVDGMSMYRGYFVPGGMDPWGLVESSVNPLVITSEFEPPLSDTEADYDLRKRYGNTSDVSSYRTLLWEARRDWRKDNEPSSPVDTSSPGPSFTDDSDEYPPPPESCPLPPKPDCQPCEFDDEAGLGEDIILRVAGKFTKIDVVRCKAARLPYSVM